MRRLTTSEHTAFVSWMLLLAASFMTAMSAWIIHSFCVELHGAATLPELSMFYLSARFWAIIVPFVFAVLGVAIWRWKGDPGLQYVSVVAHFLSVAMMCMVVFGIVLPFFYFKHSD